MTSSSKSSARRRVAVIGSLNCDLVMRVPRRPNKGETVIGTSFATFVGGKGTNQAIACARAGAEVSMVGRVGADGFGQMILDKLAQSSVSTEFVSRDPELSTGVASILIDAEGDNSICVAPQANGQLGQRDIELASRVIQGAGWVLLQLEAPLDASIAAARLARAARAGARVVLNPAPAPPDGSLPSELLKNVDLIVPNQSEAELLLGRSIRDMTDAASAASALRKLGVAAAIITMGERGAVLADADGSITTVRAFDVEVEDTTAAGDAFCGALVAALSDGLSLAEALVWGSAAGALACTKLGAEPSLPHRDQIEALIWSRS